jgi:RNA polymerase sigma-70 factor (ECF subfamily)
MLVHTPMTDEEMLVAALQRGDEAAFIDLVERYSSLMIRIAQTHVRSRAVAEEVVQETWVAVLSGVQRFEGRSSLKTWIFRILTNRAKTRGEREGREVPFSALAGEDDDEPAVDPGRFLPAEHPQWPGHWASAPVDWRTIPEDRLLGRETQSYLRAAIHCLPLRQQQVLVMRDVEGWTPDEVRAALGISEGNQRVLLHRGRSKLRAAMEPYLDDQALAGRAAA